MQIAHVSWLLSPRGGGVSAALLQLAREQSRLSRHAIRVLGVRDPADDGIPGVRTFRSIGPIALGVAPGLALDLLLTRPEIVHLHGLFTWPSQAVQLARRFGRATLIVSAHGMLAPWAMARSAWKKKLFAAAVENDNLRNATVFHALSRDEAASFRRTGIRAPIAIIPNGVDLALVPPERDKDAFAARFPQAKGRRIVLFLARVHPTKGLPHLVDAWARLVKHARLRREEWLLVIAGPDCLGHTDEVKRRAAELGIGRQVLFTGPLYADMKREALAAADVFVLPSFSEGFSIAVLEALAARVPVFLTRQCHFDVSAFGAGIVGEPTAESTQAGLGTLMELSDSDRRAWGESGRREVEACYQWRLIARKMIRTYEWALGGARPAEVDVLG